MFQVFHLPPVWSRGRLLLPEKIRFLNLALCAPACPGRVMESFVNPGSRKEGQRV